MKPSLLATALLLCAPLAAVPLGAQSTQPQDHIAGSMPAKAPVPPSHFLNLNFEGKTITLKVADLQNLPQVTVHVHNAHTGQEETYTGPLVSDVLAKVGLTASRETEPLILHSALVATGTDHYYVLYSAAEVEPMFSTGKVIVAIMKSGLPNTAGGNFELINTDGAKPARWVHGLVDLNVVSMKPTS